MKNGSWIWKSPFSRRMDELTSKIEFISEIKKRISSVLDKKDEPIESLQDICACMQSHTKDYTQAANYHSDEEGTALNYKVLSEAICQVRMGCAPLSAGWKKKIDADFERRKR